MRVRDIFRLEESTIRLGKRIVNLMAKGLMFSLAIVGFGALAIGLNLFLPIVASQLGLDDKTQVLLKAGAAVFFVVLAVTSVLFGIADVCKLFWYYWRDGESKDGRD